MPRFRSYRGGRRRGLPRSTVRSVKYIVNVGGASESAGLTAETICKGVDNATLGQSGTTDVDIPTGAKIAKFELWMPKVNLGAASANFITWSVQRTNTGQAVINPTTQGGSPLRSNVMLTGMVGLGTGQNNNLHVTFKIPPKYQRITDSQVWSIVNDNDAAVSTKYMFMYKVFM